MNIFNKNYMNAFYNKKNFLKNYNSLFEFEMKDLVNENILSNINIFDIEKLKELRKIKSLNVDSVKKEVINSDFYSYIVNLEDLRNVNYDSLIKIKVELIDHSRLDRLFLPKIIYFSPMLFANDFYGNTNSEANNKIGAYQISEYSDDRIKYFSLENLKSLQIFRNIIKEKFIKNGAILSTDNIDDIIEEIFNNHITSNSIENIIDVLHNIKIDEKQILNKISEKTYNVLHLYIDNEMFFDIFSTNKDKFIQECFTYDTADDCYIVESTRDKYDKIVMFVKYLNNIMSELNDANILNNIKNYINLNFNVLTNDFLFIINNNDETLENSDFSTSLITSKDQINNVDIIKYNIENIDIDNLVDFGIYHNTILNRNKFIKNNYSITITSEVV